LEEFATQGAEAVLAPEPFLYHLPRYDLRSDRMKAFLNGLATTDRFYQGQAGPLRVYAGDIFLGIGGYSAKDQSIRPHKVVRVAERN
jgi:tRNA pseudouridine55 synthase